jgi:ABC-type glycerol-3-phosphate transport system substrate-binding protein
MEDVYWRGDKYGMPLGITTLFTIYNADMFARAGVHPPDDRTTFASLRHDLARVKAANRLASALALSRGGDVAAAMVFANGGDMIRLVGSHNRAEIAGAPAVEALRWYTGLGWQDRLGFVPPRSANARDYPRTLFIAGQVALFFGSSQDLALIQKAAPHLRLGTAQLPAGMRGTTRGSVLGGTSLFVPQGSRHTHGAFELAKWLVSAPVALPVAHDLGLAPVIRAQYDDPFFRRDPLLAAYFRQVQTARPIGLDAYPEAYQLFLTAYNAALDGADAGAALRRAQGPIQAAMARADANIDADG